MLQHGNYDDAESLRRLHGDSREPICMCGIPSFKQRTESSALPLMGNASSVDQSSPCNNSFQSHWRAFRNRLATSSVGLEPPFSILWR